MRFPLCNADLKLSRERQRRLQNHPRLVDDSFRHQRHSRLHHGDHVDLLRRRRCCSDRRNILNSLRRHLLQFDKEQSRDCGHGPASHLDFLGCSCQPTGNSKPAAVGFCTRWRDPVGAVSRTGTYTHLRTGYASPRMEC